MSKIFPFIIIALMLLSFTLGKHMEESPRLVVEHEKLNVFYRDLPNPITVAAEGVSSENIELDITNAEYTGTDGKFNIKVTTPGEVVLDFYENKGKGKRRFLGSRTYVVKSMPKPKAYFLGKLPPYAISPKGKKSLYLNPEHVLEGIHNAIVEVDMDYDLPIYIVRFDMETEVDGKKIIHRSDDNFLSLQMLEELNRATDKQSFVFKDILAELPDKSTMYLKNFEFEILRERPKHVTWWNFDDPSKLAPDSIKID